MIDMWEYLAHPETWYTCPSFSISYKKEKICLLFSSKSSYTRGNKYIGYLLLFITCSYLAAQVCGASLGSVAISRKALHFRALENWEENMREKKRAVTWNKWFSPSASSKFVNRGRDSINRFNGNLPENKICLLLSLYLLWTNRKLSKTEIV